MKTSNIFRGLAVVLAVLGLPAFAQDASQCKLAKIVEWPVRLTTGQPVIDGEINGKKIAVMLDTGASYSMLMKASADRMDLPLRPTQDRMVGFGGSSRVYTTTLGELKVGDASRKGWRVRVTGEGPFRGNDFLLGDDFFKVVDLEFDYAAGVIRVFQPENCKNAFLAYWDANAQVVPLENEEKIHFYVKVNGRKALAMLDSGASGSIVSLFFAESVGVSRDSPGVLPGRCLAGLGGGGLRNWVGTFDQVEIGGETISAARLRIQDYLTDMAHSRQRPPDMFLGTDFLKSHRVYVSRSQGKVYFTHSGGQVFTATPSIECDERTAGKSPKEALAIVDEAIKANPGDTKALLQRAAIRRADDLPGALADLDAVIRLEANNQVALAMRSNVRASLKDFDGALADSDAAIANGARNATLYASRGAILRAKNDCARAIVEYEEALKMDPQHQAAQRGLAACRG